MIEPTAPPKLSRNEGLKEHCPTLCGTISQTLADASLDRFSEDDYEFLKFHGIYQQDDRDKRKVAKEYIFMVRGRLPGGTVPPKVYLALDRLVRALCQSHPAHYHAAGIPISWRDQRQPRQVHAAASTTAMATTLAACGDVNRNVMAAPTPATSPLVDEVQRQAKAVSDALLPKTRAYHQIWVEGVELKLTEEDANFVDPLYGKTYLPRKFKVAFVIPPLNDIDVLTNDCGFIAIIENGRLAGYNLTRRRRHGNEPRQHRDLSAAGGCDRLCHAGSGDCHGQGGGDDPSRFRRPRQSQTRPPQICHRRARRAHGSARNWNGGSVSRLGPARPFEFTRQGDLYGWHPAI